MELLVIVLALVALAVLAPRFGHDSRDHVVSSEERFAQDGFTWGPAFR